MFPNPPADTGCPDTGRLTHYCESNAQILGNASLCDVGALPSSNRGALREKVCQYRLYPDVDRGRFGLRGALVCISVPSIFMTS